MSLQRDTSRTPDQDLHHDSRQNSRSRDAAHLGAPEVSIWTNSALQCAFRALWDGESEVLMRLSALAAGLLVLASSAACTHNPSKASSKPSLSPSASNVQAEGSLACRALPAAFAASHVSVSVVRLSHTTHLLSDLVMRAPRPAFQPGISGQTAFSQSGLDREAGMRFDVFLARVSSPTQAKHTVPSFHGQVFWVIRGIKTGDPFAGLPGPVTSSDRQCASLATPVAILTAKSGRHVLTGN
jgi:hypothetical protein